MCNIADGITYNKVFFSKFIHTRNFMAYYTYSYLFKRYLPKMNDDIAICPT